MSFSILKKYKYSGTVFLGCDDNLRAATAKVPNKPGVYLFYEVNGKNEELKYIGASGSVLQNGNLKGQMMRGRLNNKMNKDFTRANFLKQHFESSKCDFIKIDWFVTLDNENQDLPKYVEAKLIQQYFKFSGKLPKWNNSF